MSAIPSKSPPCRIAMMALEYTRTPYKLVAVDPRKGDTKTAEFKKVHDTKEL